MRLLPVIIFLILACSCKQEQVDLIALEEEIKELHLATYANVNDSTVANLYYINKLYEQYPDLPSKRIAYNYHLLGRYHLAKGVQDSATYYAYRATEFVTDTIPIESATEQAYFFNAWENFKAEKRYGDCLAIARKFESLIYPQDSLKQYALYYFYTVTHNLVDEFELAAKYNKQQLKYLNLLNIPNGDTNALILEAKLQNQHFKNKDTAYTILEQLRLREENLTADQNRQVFGNYGIMLYNDGRYREAYDNYKTGISYIKAIADTPDKPIFLANSYGNLAEVSMDLKQFPRAEKYLDSALELGNKNLNPDVIRNLLKYRMRLATEYDNDYQKAALIVDTISSYLDTEYRDKYNEELVALTKANEKEKELLAQQQLDELRAIKLQNRSFLLIGFIILLVGLGTLFYRQRKLRFERQGLQMQQRLLRSQMNPHFTFNTLYAIQRQIKETPQVAQDYLLKFSRLLRLILENSMENYVLMENELESIKKYMDLQLLRFPGKFQYELELIGLEEDDPIYIPPMLIQPFVENAIEHGFSNIDYEGKIKITLEDRNKYVYCSIVDNGQGLVSSQSTNKKSASTQLISDFLSKVTGQGISIKELSEPNKNTKGTEVSFLIPVKGN